MTKEEFEKSYQERSGISAEHYKEFLVTLPCKCDYEHCEGWSAVSNNPLSIKIHNDIYNKEEK